MKMIVEHEYADERTTPITIAQAIIRFSMVEHEDEEYCREDFIETVDYLNVYVKHLKSRLMTNAFCNPDV